MSRTDDATFDAGRTLIPLARSAIAQGLGRPESADATAPWLRTPGACFVTLTQHRELRGCIGSLEAHRPLLADVRANALGAAFRDPRFSPLTAGELEITEVEVSLLSPMQPLSFDSEDAALAQLRPGEDGVVLQFGARRSTFLPQVWEQLPDIGDFMAQLKRKAGLPANFWHDDVRLQRYTVSKWKESELRQAQPAA